ANQGAAGVDGQSITDFEADLSNNLYKLWNRLASGSYFPPPVRRVTYRRTMVEPGRWGYPRSPIASPRWWSKEPWSRSWNHTSTTIHTGTDPANRRLMQSAWRGSGAGVTTGCSIWTSNPSSTKSTESC